MDVPLGPVDVKIGLAVDPAIGARGYERREGDRPTAVQWRSALVIGVLLLVVGNGLNAIVRPQGPHSYLQTIFPGIVAMTILYSAIFR